MKKGEIFLIPTPIHNKDEFKKELIPPIVYSQINKLKFFAVENIRTARRFIKKINPEFDIDNSHFEVLDKRTNNSTLEKIISQINNGKSIGILSEAGCPGIADPGQKLCEMGHKNNIRIKPLIGPSSIILALMASGLNGQNFTFHGYIPIDQGERIKKIKALCKIPGSHIFIETPYRNEKLFQDLIKNLSPSTKKLCIAVDICGENEKIVTKTVKEMKDVQINMKKQPTIFIFE
jgi:16S rRNA (cytidine1402-2'-O)-methyltransferase